MKVFIFEPVEYLYSGRLVVIAENKKYAEKYVRDYLGLDTLKDLMRLDSIKDLESGVILEYQNTVGF